MTKIHKRWLGEKEVLINFSLLQADNYLDALEKKINYMYIRESRINMAASEGTEE